MTGAVMAEKKRIEVDADQVLRDYYEKTEDPPEAAAEIAEAAAAGERSAGQQQLLKRLREHTDRSPDLSAEDVDAAWDRADIGEEVVSGSSPTPDQDIVEEVGEAIGVTYQDREPLVMDEKLAKRDVHRWELDPASSEDYQERNTVVKRFVNRLVRAVQGARRSKGRRGKPVR
jgi:hypothetical protein